MTTNTLKTVANFNVVFIAAVLSLTWAGSTVLAVVSALASCFVLYRVIEERFHPIEVFFTMLLNFILLLSFVFFGHYMPPTSAVAFVFYLAWRMGSR